MAVVAVVAFLAGNSTSDSAELESDLDAAEARVASLESQLDSARDDIQDERQRRREAEDELAASATDDEPDDEAEPAGPVVITGTEGNTEPFDLPGGDLRVTVTTDSPNCFVGLFINRAADNSFPSETIPNLEDGATEATTRWYAFEADTYYLEANVSAGCSYTATFAPVE